LFYHRLVSSSHYCLDVWMYLAIYGFIFVVISFRSLHRCLSSLYLSFLRICTEKNLRNCSEVGDEKLINNQLFQFYHLFLKIFWIFVTWSKWQTWNLRINSVFSEVFSIKLLLLKFERNISKKNSLSYICITTIRVTFYC